MRRIALAVVGTLVVAACCAAFPSGDGAKASPAILFTPQDIFIDYLDGNLDANYTTAELGAYLADSTLDDWGDPTLLAALDRVVITMLSERYATPGSSTSSTNDGQPMNTIGWLQLVLAVISGVGVPLCQFVWLLRRGHEKRSGLRREWMRGDAAARRHITYGYLFRTLAYYLAGSVLLTLPTIAAFLSVAGREVALAYSIVVSIAAGLAFGFYLVAFMSVIGYLRLRTTPVEQLAAEDENRVNTP